MAEPSPMTFEERLKAEVDRAVAPYKNLAPPVVLRKMRELAERYFREHPEASRILRIVHENQQQQQQKSGTRATRHDDGELAAAKRTKKV